MDEIVESPFYYKYGIKELLFHLLYLAKEEGYEEETTFNEGSFYKSSVDKMVTVAYAYCLKYEFPIRYDILLHKNDYGVYSEGVRSLLEPRYGVGIGFKQGEPIEDINKYYPKLNEIFKKILKLESEDPLSTARLITGSKVYQTHQTVQYQISIGGLTEEGGKNVEYDVWLKQEILTLALSLDSTLDEDNKEISLERINSLEEVDNSIPLESDEFDAINKYILLVNMGVLNRQMTVEFTYDEMMVIRSTSRELINAVEAFGAHRI